MKIQQIRRDKDEYMEMLLMADPCKDVINSYLDKGEMFALVNGGDVCAVCVVELLKNRKCELKSIVTRKEEQGKGYAKYLLRHVCEHYGNQCDTMYAGTGNRRKTLEFLGKCGFVNSHIVANYYPEHYREPIYEGGVRLTDKIYLKKQLDSEVNVKKVVDLALEAGRILLKNGAEIFRVDETMTRICQRFHVEYVDTFILSHAIFISAENGMEETYTKVKQVPLSSSHLGIVAEVNELSREIAEGLAVEGGIYIDKPTFGWVHWDERSFGEIELVGLCTDICVVSNALILKAMFPEVEITVDASCCAGVTPETHRAALETMKMCQIRVVGA